MSEYLGEMEQLVNKQVRLFSSVSGCPIAAMGKLVTTGDGKKKPGMWHCCIDVVLLYKDSYSYKL